MHRGTCITYRDTYPDFLDHDFCHKVHIIHTNAFVHTIHKTYIFHSDTLYCPTFFYNPENKQVADHRIRRLVPILLLDKSFGHTQSQFRMKQKLIFNGENRHFSLWEDLSFCIKKIAVFAIKINLLEVRRFIVLFQTFLRYKILSFALRRFIFWLKKIFSWYEDLSSLL